MKVYFLMYLHNVFFSSMRNETETNTLNSYANNTLSGTSLLLLSLFVVRVLLFGHCAFVVLFFQRMKPPSLSVEK